MKFTIILFAFILCAGLPQAQSLQCYICDDCEDITDQELWTCSPEIPPTDAPETTNGAPDTTTVAPDTTTVAPDTTTAAPDTTTAAPDTTTAAPDTTTAAPDTTTAAPDTTVDPGPGPPEEDIIRRKRHITRTKPLENNGCYCTDKDNCDCGNKLSQRLVASDDSDNNFVCYKVLLNIESTSSVRVVRGCGPSHLLGQPFCDLASTIFPTGVTSCTTCDTDGCNAAITLRQSVFLIIVSITALWYNKIY